MLMHEKKATFGSTQPGYNPGDIRFVQGHTADQIQSESIQMEILAISEL